MNVTENSSIHSDILNIFVVYRKISCSPTKHDNYGKIMLLSKAIVTSLEHHGMFHNMFGDLRHELWIQAIAYSEGFVADFASEDHFVFAHDDAE